MSPKFNIMSKLINILCCILLFSSSIINSQTQIGNDIDGNESQDRFGYSVDLNDTGSTIIIGTIRGGDNDGGYVRILKRMGNEWVQKGSEIHSENGYESFGFSVGINSDGSRIVVGSPFSSDNGESSGSVKVFDFINNDWVQNGNTVFGKNENDWAGREVEISADGKRFALGAFHNDGDTDESSHVRVYELNNNAWEQIGEDIDGINPVDFFGGSIAMNFDGSRFAAGATHAGAIAGQVRVFEFIDNEWIQLGSTLDAGSGDQFGVNVSFDKLGNRLAVGAPGLISSQSSGYVRVFDLVNDSWQQIGGNILSGDVGDFFGYGVDLDNSGNYLIASAAYGELYGNETGYIRLYELLGNDWTQIGEDMIGENEEDKFGFPISISGDGNTIAGAAHWNDVNGINTGHVRVFDVNILNIGVFEGSLNKISFYPNPAKEEITFSNPNQISIDKISFYDSQSRLIHFLNSKDIINNTISLKDINSGVYFLKLETNKGIVSSQIIIEK
ncbi:hypothetical protein SCB49_06527 [unidentified eubacterium SCB49]|nr:hypothetical protein SCB49_06527 [unidentified eubacterium SCB49]